MGTPPRTSSQLELLPRPPDLQFIRINGTVVGGGRWGWPCTPFALALA